MVNSTLPSGQSSVWHFLYALCGNPAFPLGVTAPLRPTPHSLHTPSAPHCRQAGHPANLHFLRALRDHLTPKSKIPRSKRLGGIHSFNSVQHAHDGVGESQPHPTTTPLFRCAFSAASLGISTRRALLPSKAPRMPAASNWSTIRPARL